MFWNFVIGEINGHVLHRYRGQPLNQNRFADADAAGKGKCKKDKEGKRQCRHDTFHFDFGLMKKKDPLRKTRTRNRRGLMPSAAAVTSFREAARRDYAGSIRRRTLVVNMSRMPTCTTKSLMIFLCPSLQVQSTRRITAKTEVEAQEQGKSASQESGLRRPSSWKFSVGQPVHWRKHFLARPSVRSATALMPPPQPRCAPSPPGTACRGAVSWVRFARRRSSVRRAA